MFQNDVIQICNSFRNGDLYVSPGIPNDKLCALAFSTMMPTSTQVLALIDTTVFGSAKNGMLITSNGLYIHNDNTGDKPGNFYISWDMMLQTENTMFPLKVGLGELALMPGIQFEFSGCSLNADQLIPLLMNLRSAYKKYSTASQPQSSPQSAPMFTQQAVQTHQAPPEKIKCPFCDGIIDAALSNCPHCRAAVTKMRQPSQRKPQPQSFQPIQNNPAGAPHGIPPQNIVLPPAQKSRTVYIVLALFFGCLGVHNFYAGRNGEGVAQLLLSVLTLGVGTILTGPWALINIFTVKTDCKGVPFA